MPGTTEPTPGTEVILDYIERTLITDGIGLDMGPDELTLDLDDLDWARPTGATMSVVRGGELYAAGARGYTTKPGHPLRRAGRGPEASRRHPARVLLQRPGTRRLRRRWRRKRGLGSLVGFCTGTP